MPTCLLWISSSDNINSTAGGATPPSSFSAWPPPTKKSESFRCDRVREKSTLHTALSYLGSCKLASCIVCGGEAEYCAGWRQPQPTVNTGVQRKSQQKVRTFTCRAVRSRRRTTREAAMRVRGDGLSITRKIEARSRLRSSTHASTAAKRRCEREFQYQAQARMLERHTSAMGWNTARAHLPPERCPFPPSCTWAQCLSSACRTSSGPHATTAPARVRVRHNPHPLLGGCDHTTQHRGCEPKHTLSSTKH